MINTWPQRSRQILQILDKSHEDWVLGGIFRELRDDASEFAKSPLVFSGKKDFLNPARFLSMKRKISKYEVLFFSSISPLTKYFYYLGGSRKKTILLWFTHESPEFSDRERGLLKKVDIIFVHSKEIAQHLRVLTQAEIIVVIGAISPERFSTPAKPGNKIAWVGTSVSRKRPEALLDLASRSPNLNFKLLGHGWQKSPLWNRVLSIRNIEYVEVQGPLTSKDFDYCDVYLSTSALEGGPMPLMEALASGLKPLATGTGFTRDIIEICNLSEDNLLTNLDHFESKLMRLREKNHSAQPRRTMLEYHFNRLQQLIIQAANGDYDQN